MKTTLKGMLKRLFTDGGDYNFLIVHLDNNNYMQFLSGRGGEVLVMETSSNVDALQDLKLKDLGWDNDNEHGNYVIAAYISEELYFNNCVNLIEKTAKQIFNIDTIDMSNIETNFEGINTPSINPN